MKETLPRRTRFNNLDALRGLAALMVAFGHLTFVPTSSSQMNVIGSEFVHYPSVACEWWNFLVFLSTPSQCYVMIFFLLSGFVLEPSIVTSSARAFAKRRFVRLWIPATVAQLLYFLIAELSFHHHISLGKTLLSIPLINGGLPGKLGDVFVFPVVWTLWYEARYSFYLYFAKCLKISPQVRFGVAIFTPLIYCLCGHFVHTLIYNDTVANLLVGNALISVGGICYRIYQRQQVSRTFLIPIIFLYFFLLRYPIGGFFNAVSGISFGLALFGFALCLVFEAQNRTPSKIFKTLGKYSYSIYLSHFIFGIQTYLILLPHLGIALSFGSALIVAVLGTKIFFQLVEKPSLEYIKKFSQKERGFIS